jgi:PPOX class probable F420-dependent enzyme
LACDDLAMAELPADVRALFEGANFAHIATVLPDGGPHTVPIWVELEGDRIAFFTQEGSRKARNIARDPRVALSIADFDNPYRYATVRGRVVDRVDGEAALEVMDRMSVRTRASRSRTASRVSPTSSSPSGARSGSSGSSTRRASSRCDLSDRRAR